jgi:mRNA interferase MazF
VVPLAAGALALVPFPFSDLSSAKIRPAIVLARAGGEDWILCQLTSRPYGDRRAVGIHDTDLVSGTLRVESFARPGKLFTASTTLVVASIGRLRPERLASIVDVVVTIVRGDP